MNHTYLTVVDLSFNNFQGIVELDMFMKLPNLVSLDSGENKLTVLNKNSVNGTLPKPDAQGLGSCNLVKFPSILKFQAGLQMLLLTRNKILGIV